MATRRKANDKHVGDQAGHLTIIDKRQVFDSEKQPWRPRIEYLVECDCGESSPFWLRSNQIVLDKHRRPNFHGGNGITTCGRKECVWSVVYNLDVRQTAISKIIEATKSNAKTRGLKYDLARDEVIVIIEDVCRYCGKSPEYSNCAEVRSNSQKIRDVPNELVWVYRYNGIDRVDSTKGYEQGNCVSCCSICNVFKNDQTLVEFLASIDGLIEHRPNLEIWAREIINKS